ncbi:MAG: peptide ABC transporter substrate-binding protein, partial [Candidatus Eremiobacteraeota bacterium]|nr:peptide ABC transporter substrate-binding protein [Candidatus Eremiobacteraeota bacterium]
EPDTLNPLLGNQQIDNDLSMLWGGYFFNVDDRDAFVPELAAFVPTLANGGISRDGRTVVYHLRRGVLWQDGKPFTAADVVFTWHAIMSPQNNIPSRVGYDLIGAIDVRDPYTIAVHLRRPYAPFVGTFFAMSGDPYPVLPAHLLAGLPSLNQASYNAQPLGTGPFIVERWQRGQKIIFRANPRYWRGRPRLDRIEYTAIADESTLLTQMQSHEADLWFNAPSPDYPTLQRIRDLEIRLTPFTAFSQIALNLAHPPLGDVRIRHALGYATNADRLLATVTHGVHIRGDSDQPAFSWAHANGLPRYDYDPARARALLEAAGWRAGPDGIRIKNGARLSLVASSQTGSATANAVEVALQRDWRDVGVDLAIKNYVTSLFFASYGAGGIAQTGKFDAGFFAWYNGVDPDDSTQFMCDQTPPNGQNLYHLCDPSLDAAERVAVTNNDPATRKRAYDTIQRRLAEDEPFILLWFVRRIDVWNPDLRNFRPAHAVTDFWNSWEWQI